MYTLYIQSYLPLLPSMVHVEEGLEPVSVVIAWGLESLSIVMACGLPSTKAQRKTINNKITFVL